MKARFDVKSDFGLLPQVMKCPLIWRKIVNISNSVYFTDGFYNNI